MLRNYLRIAVRNILKDRLYSLIHVVGLSVGVACCVLIVLWVHDELSYDTFHENSDQIQRIYSVETRNSGSSHMAVTPANLGPALVEEIPEVISAVRLAISNVTAQTDDKVFRENRFTWVDASFFDVFSFDLVSGDPDQVLSDPNSIVLTEEMSHKYFGDADPIGQVISIHGRAVGVPFEKEFKVSGVLKDIPHNSTIRANFLVSFKALEAIATAPIKNWDFFYFWTYALLQKSSPIEGLSKKITEAVSTHSANHFKGTMAFEIQPMVDIHLHSDLLFEAPHGDIVYVYIFSAVALLILLIACANFMNLATARAAKRAREVGVKKVLGASRTQLVFQFMSESVLTSLIAMLLAIGFIELFLPTFNELSQKELNLMYFSDWKLAGAFLAAIALVAIAAGSYPAFFLSAFKPIRVLKGALSGTQSNARLRKGLIIFQFCISIVLMTGTAVVLDQIEFIKNKKLGFDKEHIALVGLSPTNTEERFQALRTELLQVPEITEVARTTAPPGGLIVRYGYRAAGMPPDEQVVAPTIYADPEYLQLLNVQLVAGRYLTRSRGTDTAALIVNMAAVEKFGFGSPQNALGKTIEGDITGTVVGIMEDFHFSSLRRAIIPLVVGVSPGTYSFIALKSRAGENTLAYIEQKVKSFQPGHPYEFQFLDDRLNQLYVAETRLGSIFGYFAVFAILVACLGLFGLASFMSEQRTKEVGIRKVHGASTQRIVILMTKDFTKLILIAFLIACPLAYWLMSNWLTTFAYHTQLGFGIFCIVGLATVGIAWLAVGYNSIMAALSNPVEALRYE